MKKKKDKSEDKPFLKEPVASYQIYDKATVAVPTQEDLADIERAISGKELMERLRPQLAELFNK